MFLDTTLGLSLWGAILLYGVLLLLLSAVAGLVLGIGFRRKGRKLLSWLMIAPSFVVLLSITALLIYVFADFRSHKQILIDLRKPQSSVLADLKNACPTAETKSAFCDSENYTYDVRVVFSDNAQLSVAADRVRWTEDDEKTISYISFGGRNSQTLPAARKLLFQHAATFSDTADPKTRQEIDKAAEWILKCCKDNAVYSEVYSVQLRPKLGLEFRKNIDEISIDYSIEPSP